MVNELPRLGEQLIRERSILAIASQRQRLVIVPVAERFDLRTAVHGQVVPLPDVSVAVPSEKS